MHQKDVAALVNATTSTVTNWEKGRTSPGHYLQPKVIEFLGYNPLTGHPSTLGERIKYYRKKHGLSIKKLAGVLGIDPGTFARSEKRVLRQNRRITGIFARVLKK